MNIINWRKCVWGGETHLEPNREIRKTMKVSHSRNAENIILQEEGLGQ
jgi:hypothetical protein